MRTSSPYRFGSIGAKTPLAFAGQRIGLLGGSFNPPHAAHRLISETALKRLGLDRVWWIVTPGNPLKSDRGLLPLDERMALCRTVARNRRIVVTAFEQGLPSRYSAATVGFLKRRHPGVRFVWLMGADCLVEFHRWRLWREMLANMPMAVIDRPGSHLKALAGPAAGAFARQRRPETMARRLASARPPAWTLLTGPLSSLSSTAIRADRTRHSP
ncbi:MAG: nicotinate-nucleotide adenylyltransferase [Hyphomicrobiaceae bacterium]